VSNYIRTARDDLISDQQSKRQDAVERLAHSEAASAKAELEQALKSQHKDVRILAAVAIAKNAPQKALPMLIDALALPKTEGDKDDPLFIASGRALKGLGQVAVPPLLDSLKSRDPVIWTNAATILGDMETVEAIDPLMDKLKLVRPRGEGGDPRDSIVKALGYIGDKRAIPALALVIQSNKESDVTRYFAVLAINSIGGEEAVTSLLTATKTADGILLTTIVVYLGKLRDPSAVPFLEQMLSDDKETIAYDSESGRQPMSEFAAEALKLIGGREAEAALSRVKDK
jgi:HEAT repeat protein